MPQDHRVVKAVVATATSTLIVAGIFFFFFYKLAMARQRRRNKFSPSFCREETVVAREEYRQQHGKLRGLIVDENGLDVLYYMRKPEQGQFSRCFSKVRIHQAEEKRKRMDSSCKQKDLERIQEISLLDDSSNVLDFAEVEKPVSIDHLPSVTGKERVQNIPPQPPLPPVGRSKQSPPSPQPPPPPPPPRPKIVFRPPSLPLPHPASNPIKGMHTPPPPSQNHIATGRWFCSIVGTPSAPRGDKSNNNRRGAPTRDCTEKPGDVHMKLKPLHWDKVTANADHSLVWDVINDGSFLVDDDLIEAIFGYTASNQRSTESSKSSSSANSNSNVLPRIFILEPRKSQNIAIVLRSLAISHTEIVDALLEGNALNPDILEKLTKISPTQEEASKILQFSGNPKKLADAEAFLHHFLKAIPTAFIRINAMLFRLSYDSEILHLKQSLQTLRLGCKELRTRGIFFKLLEAILKAGNRMNAGTARGNAQDFNLSALQKLTNVKSTDGKTTLLHFVVEQVVRSEGKRCAADEKHSLGRRVAECGNNKEKEERDYLLLGQPALKGLSVEFSNVKKAATIDYDSFINTASNLIAQVGEIQQMVMSCGSGERGGFVREMEGFLEECWEELKMVREEQTRVMDLVKRTTTYYQAGALKDMGARPLQLFVIVKDFLDMVDQVRIEITRKLQKRKAKSVESSPPIAPPPRSPVRFPNFESHLISDKSHTASSE
ncbi:hypothetical protein NMG60_11009548 [Bertholletia excelsa]